MTANWFAVKYWGADEDKQYLFAYSGKKALLCAGSYLSRLEIKNLVRWHSRKNEGISSGYYLTKIGKQAIDEYEREILANLAPVQNKYC